MNDPDRFTEFLVREAAGYNEPPATPAGAMWRRVEARLGRRAGAGSADDGCAAAGETGDPPLDGFSYHDPPLAPRNEMWPRIEAAWALRRSATPAAAGTGAARRWRPVWMGRRGATGWVAALAAAASLVLGIALGRGTQPPEPGEPSTLPAAPSLPASVEPALPAPVTIVEREAPERYDPGEPVRSAAITGQVTAAAAAPAGDEMMIPRLEAVSGRPEDHVALTARAEPEIDYVTAHHLGRAATLLTAFRTDPRTPASEQDLARWARELLAETRMFLGLADSGSPVEHALLQDLELVLIQIAGLGPGAPEFEWDLARESMERQGTLMKLRAASAGAET